MSKDNYHQETEITIHSFARSLANLAWIDAQNYETIILNHPCNKTLLHIIHYLIFSALQELAHGDFFSSEELLLKPGYLVTVIDLNVH